MAVNVSVQYNGGLLPDIILLTQGYFHLVPPPSETWFRGMSVGGSFWRE